MGEWMASGKLNFAVFAMGSAAILISGMMPAKAQNPPAPPPASSVIPASTLDNLPHHDISNGIVSAKVYLPGDGGFYRGTRFDRAGVVAHATYKGNDYGQYWFSSYSPLVHDFAWRDHQVTVSTASGAAGPAEEFTQIGFDEAGQGGKFLKVGVGILKRDTATYDFVHTYPVVNEGKRGRQWSKHRAKCECGPALHQSSALVDAYVGPQQRARDADGGMQCKRRVLRPTVYVSIDGLAVQMQLSRTSEECCIGVQHQRAGRLGGSYFFNLTRSAEKPVHLPRASWVRATMRRPI